MKKILKEWRNFLHEGLGDVARKLNKLYRGLDWQQIHALMTSLGEADWEIFGEEDLEELDKFLEDYYWDWVEALRRAQKYKERGERIKQYDWGTPEEAEKLAWHSERSSAMAGRLKEVLDIIFKDLEKQGLDKKIDLSDYKKVPNFEEDVPVGGARKVKIIKENKLMGVSQ